MSERREANEAHLSIRDVSVSFGRSRVLSDVRVDCTSRLTGIVGPNGAGKSTLLNVVSGQLRPDSGSLRLAGVDISAWPAARRSRAGVGRSFQHPVLADALTVEETVGLAVRARSAAAARARVRSTAERFGIEPWLARHAHELPYGVRKLVDIARAAAAQPTVLLCDEPLSGLDEVTRDEVVRLLRSIADDGTPVIVVEHDVPRLSQLAAEIVVLDLGRVIAQGAPRDVLADERVVEAFVGVPDVDDVEAAADEGAAATKVAR